MTRQMTLAATIARYIAMAMAPLAAEPPSTTARRDPLHASVVEELLANNLAVTHGKQAHFIHLHPRR